MQDIRVDQNFDLIIDNGDFSVGFSDIQHVEHLMLADQGSLPNVLIGAGIRKSQNGVITPDMESDINKMIELDGIDGITVGITESGITIYSDGL